MAISSRLNKRLRASRDDDEDDFEEEISSSVDEREDASDYSDKDEDDDEESVVSEEEDSENASAESDQDEDDGDQSTGSANDREAIQSEFRKISFGALAKAQNSLGRKRKRGADTIAEDKAPSSSSSSSTLEDVREKLRRARERKLGLNRNGSIGRNETKRNETETETENRFSKPNPPPSRSSKHAPTVLSSKMAVSRKRIVIEPPASATKSRDPRFDPTVLASSSSSSSAAAAAGRHKDASEKAYAFLDEYRAAELKQLKDQLARTKDVAAREELKRAITSATDRQRALDHKKREREVLSEHKRREKQLIKEGKKSQPYYLKKSELKKEVLKKKYESMGSRERAKALERKRKRVASKEKKDLPWSRRGME